MRRAAVVLAAILAAPQAAPRTHGKSVRGALDGIPTLVLRGAHRERGRDHGCLCAQEIVRLVDAPERGVSATKGRWVTLEWDRIFARS